MKTPWPRSDNSWPTRRYRHCEEIPAARELLGRCYQLQKKYPEAIRVWREYLVKHPAHKQWSAVQREIIDAEYLMAADKLAAKQYDAANRLFAEFMAKYPLDARLPGILLLMNDKPYAEGKWDEAIANWRRLASKYPDSPEASLAQFSIAGTLEWKLGKLEEALEEYRKVAGGPAAGEALQAIARLTATSMTRGHGTRLPQRRNAAAETGDAERRVGDGPRVQRRSGDVFPQDAPGPGRRGARHRADRSRQDVRVQGAQLRQAPASGELDRRAAAPRRARPA